MRQEERRQQQSCNRPRLISGISFSSNPAPEKENRLYQAMQENLRQQKLLNALRPRHLPEVPFNGPFFTVAKVRIKQQRFNFNLKLLKLQISLLMPPLFLSSWKSSI